MDGGSALSKSAGWLRRWGIGLELPQPRF